MAVKVKRVPMDGRKWGCGGVSECDGYGGRERLCWVVIVMVGKRGVVVDGGGDEWMDG